MKILFVMLGLSLEDKSGGMYSSLSEQFQKNGHDVTIIAPDEAHCKTFIGIERGVRVVRVASKQTQGVSNMFKKGVALATLSFFLGEVIRNIWQERFLIG